MKTSLERFQWLLLGVIPLVAMHRYRHVIWRAPVTPITTPAEFTGIVLFLVDYALAAAIIVGALRWLFDQDSTRHFANTAESVIRTRGGFAWVGLVVWMGAGVLWAYDPPLARYATLHTACCLLMSFWLADIVRSGHGTPLLIVYVSGAAAHGLLALAQYGQGGGIGLSWLGESRFVFVTGTFRAYGLTDNPNSLGGYLAVALFASLALLYRFTGTFSWKTGLAALATLVIGLGLFTTLSRGAIGAALVALIPLGAAVRGRYRRLATPHKLILAGIVLLALAGGAASFGQPLQERLIEVTSDEWQPEQYYFNRNFYLADTNAAIKESGLWGVSSNNLMTAIARLRLDSFGVRYPVHNVYWLIRAENGWPGLFLFLIALGTAFIGIRWREISPALIWGCGLLAIVLMMMVEFYFWASPHSVVLLFFVLGMVWGHVLPQDEEPERAG